MGTKKGLNMAFSSRRKATSKQSNTTLISGQCSQAASHFVLPGAMQLALCRLSNWCFQANSAQQLLLLASSTV